MGDYSIISYLYIFVYDLVASVDISISFEASKYAKLVIEQDWTSFLYIMKNSISCTFRWNLFIFYWFLAVMIIRKVLLFFFIFCNSLTQDFMQNKKGPGCNYVSLNLIFLSSQFSSLLYTVQYSNSSCAIIIGTEDCTMLKVWPF